MSNKSSLLRDRSHLIEFFISLFHENESKHEIQDKLKIMEKSHNQLEINNKYTLIQYIPKINIIIEINTNNILKILKIELINVFDSLESCENIENIFKQKYNYIYNVFRDLYIEKEDFDTSIINDNDKFYLYSIYLLKYYNNNNALLYIKKNIDGEEFLYNFYISKIQPFINNILNNNKNFIYIDFKASNIMIDDNGDVKIFDFEPKKCIDIHMQEGLDSCSLYDNSIIISDQYVINKIKIIINFIYNNLFLLTLDIDRNPQNYNKVFKILNTYNRMHIDKIINIYKSIIPTLFNIKNSYLLFINLFEYILYGLVDIKIYDNQNIKFDKHTIYLEIFKFYLIIIKIDSENIDSIVNPYELLMKIIYILRYKYNIIIESMENKQSMNNIQINDNTMTTLIFTLKFNIPLPIDAYNVEKYIDKYNTIYDIYIKYKQYSSKDEHKEINLSTNLQDSSDDKHEQSELLIPQHYTDLVFDKYREFNNEYFQYFQHYYFKNILNKHFSEEQMLPFHIITNRWEKKYIKYKNKYLKIKNLNI